MLGDIAPATSTFVGIPSQPRRKCRLVQRSGGEGQNYVRGIFFGCEETVAIHFQEEHTDDESSPLVAVDEWVIPNDAYRVGRSHIDDVGRIAVRTNLLRTSESGRKESFAAEACRTAIESKETVMQYEDVALVDPDRPFHFESACNVLR